MSSITPDTTLEELAVLVSAALERAGIAATLSGGAAVSIYSDNEYLSHDLDFVSSDTNAAIEQAMAPLGFHRIGRQRQFEHPDTKWFLEFPPGPVAFGSTHVSHDDVPVLETAFGPLRIVTPTQIIMDRLSAYAAWNDTPSLDQAELVASRQQVEWEALHAWAAREGIDAAVVDRLRG